MITYESFAEYCKQNGMHCVLRDGMMPKSKGITMVFKEQEGRQPDVTVELDFLSDGNVQTYLYGFMEELPSVSVEEMLARLNVTNAYTPHVNFLIMGKRVVQLCHDVTDGMSHQDLMRAIKYRVQMSLFFTPLFMTPQSQYNMMQAFQEDDQEDIDDDDFFQEEW